jgi:hypothetical protein
MINSGFPIAQAFPNPPQLKLFQDSGLAGIVVLCIFIGGMLTWFGFALIGHYKRKRLELLPAILGDRHAMLDHICTLAGLGISHRYLLNKVAFRMRLSQPASIVLSPELLVEAAKTWHKTHRFTPTQAWGINKLDHIARHVYEKSLSELGYRTPNSA